MNPNEEVYQTFRTNIDKLSADKPIDLYGTEVLAQTAMALTTAEQLAKIAVQLQMLNDREDILSRRDFHIKTEIK